MREQSLGGESQSPQRKEPRIRPSRIVRGADFIARPPPKSQSQTGSFDAPINVKSSIARS
jgi:hypothetical protein